MLSNSAKQNICKGLVGASLVSFGVTPLKVNAAPVEEQNVIDYGREIYDEYNVCKTVNKLTISVLPINYTKNGVLERVNSKTGKVMQRRYYDENGMAKLDIDYTSHGATNSSTEGIHKHEWENGKRSVAKQLTAFEKVKYEMLPRGYKGNNKPLEGENSCIPLSYDNFKKLLIQNHEFKLELDGNTYNIAYGKDKREGNVKYYLTRFNPNLLYVGTIEQESYYSKQGILEEKIYRGKTIEEVWNKIIVKEIY